MVVGLGLDMAKAVAACQHRKAADQIAAETRLENSRAQHQEDRSEHVGQVVDDVVEQCTVEVRDAPAHFEQARERTVAGINRGGDRHRDEARAKIAARGVID